MTAKAGWITVTVAEDLAVTGRPVASVPVAVTLFVVVNAGFAVQE